MPTMVALLRGVNVGGKGRLAMADLRAVAEQLGHTDVRTYVQSGNLVFSTTTRSTKKVASDLEDAIAAATDVAPAVVVRSAAQLAAAIAADPYVARGEDPGAVHLTFFAGRAPAPGELSSLGEEEAVAIRGEVHLFLPGGIGRSKLAQKLARKTGEGTTRNWRTVTTLHAMAVDDA